jgi:hypothetical protein
MFNFIDIMRAAQGGQAIENMARQFGLTPDQTRHAVAALLPAFAMGLQQAASRPDHLEQIFEAMRSGRYDAFFESPRSAFSKKARTSGEDLLATMFGSPELAQRIAEQSAAFSGIAAETATKMMPLVATTLMGGMAKSAQNQDFGSLFARMMNPVKQPEPAPPANPWEQMFGVMMQGMQGAGQGGGQGGGNGGAQAGAADAAPAPADPPTSANPFEEMLAAMLRVSTPAEPEPPPKTEAEQAAEEAFANYQRMLQMGREMQDQHLLALKSMFDAFWTKRS